MTKALPLPDREVLHDLFEDIGDTIRWRAKPSVLVAEGAEVRSTLRGYYRVMLNRKTYMVHRILYKMRTGCEPEYLDHADGNPLNNAPTNLRPATGSLNNANRRMPKNSSSGFKNVMRAPRTNGKWIARVRFDGKSYTSTTFDNIEDAAKAAKDLRAAIHGSFSRDC